MISNTLVRCCKKMSCRSVRNCLKILADLMVFSMWRCIQRLSSRRQKCDTNILKKNEGGTRKKWSSDDRSLRGRCIRKSDPTENVELNQERLDTRELNLCAQCVQRMGATVSSTHKELRLCVRVIWRLRVLEIYTIN